jgi:hypothetical protein
VADETPPSGGSITVPNCDDQHARRRRSTRPPRASDSQSGVFETRIERQQVTFTNGLVQRTVAGHVDRPRRRPGAASTPVASGFCYQYRRVVVDNVGNRFEDASPNTVRVDNQPPSGTFDPTARPARSAAWRTITGTASDGNAGVASDRAHLRPARRAARCAPARSPPPPDPRAWSCGVGHAGARRRRVHDGVWW